MVAVRYDDILKYEERKKTIVKYFSDKQGIVRRGFDNDLLVGGILRTVDYFNYHLPNMRIKREHIPDVHSFKEPDKEQYSIAEFIFSRIEKNIKEVRFYDEVPKEKQNKQAIGGYNSSTHTLEIYKNNFFEYIKEHSVGQSENYKKNLMEAIFVHELIHAISDTNRQGQVGLRYIDKTGKRVSVSINEGVTESLAMDICSLKNVFFSTHTLKYRVNSNTVSAYKLETNIANLLKIADGDKFYLKYLVDAPRISLAKDGEDVMKKVIDITNKYDPSRELRENKINDYQKIQDTLIEYVFENRLQKGVLEPVRNGEKIDEKAFKKLRKELKIIGDCLIPSMNEIVSGEELDFNTTVHSIREMIQEGKIKRTSNIEKYILLLGAMKEVERDFNIPLKQNRI